MLSFLLIAILISVYSTSRTECFQKRDIIYGTHLPKNISLIQLAVKDSSILSRNCDLAYLLTNCQVGRILLLKLVSPLRLGTGSRCS
jgi:hypothetical protein